ncbi:MAG: RecQ family ATP-dependent DNA helicase, partial [Longimicrobiales bacterium]|nr:RecQ family ATP-dependent DNA helicase [Longimicrobiales bacterium]
MARRAIPSPGAVRFLAGVDPLLVLLRERFGHPGFRPGQEPLVRALLAGRDALGLLPTGGGKSLTYLLPALLLDRPVLVVSPLVALMADQLRRAREAGLRAEALAGPVAPPERERVLDAVRRGALDLLLLAPERLKGRTGTRLLEAGVGALVVDEAHCLVQWGYDFRPDYLVLAGLGPALGIPVLALTATATPALRRTLAATLGLRDPVRVVQSFDRPNLTWEARRVADEGDRWPALWQAVGREPGAQIVYAGTRGAVERLADALRRRGVCAGAYHAGLPREVRADVQDRFLAGAVRVMVATNAFGMGVDKPDIRAVTHWSPPASLEAYYQEAGRGGRDGAPARALVLWSPPDLRALDQRLAGSFPPLSVLARAVLGVRRDGWPETPAAWSALARRCRTGGGREGGAPLERALVRLWGGDAGT